MYIEVAHGWISPIKTCIFMIFLGQISNKSSGIMHMTLNTETDVA